MKTRIIFTTLCIFTSILGKAQFNTINWQHTIGAEAREDLRSVQKTSDGGIIIAGVSESNASGDKSENSMGNHDLWIVKLDVSGAIEWENTIGGSGIDYIQSRGTVIQATLDGGYIVGCNSDSPASGDKSENSNGLTDYWIIKLNSLGEIEWENTIGGSGTEIFAGLTIASNGNYVVAGTSNSNISGDKTQNSKGFSDYWIVTLDSFGSILWQKTIGGNLGDILEEIKTTSDGGYIIGGWSNSDISGDKTEASRGDDDYWIVKLDIDGNIEWDKTLGGSGTEYFSRVLQTNDGGFIISGDSHSNISGDKTENSIGGTDLWLLKLSNEGEIIWQNTIGGNDVDVRPITFQSAEGGYLVLSSSNSNISGDKTENSKGELDYWILKLNDSGEIQWQKTIGGDRSEIVWDFYQNSDNSYTIAGLSNSDISGDKSENSKGQSDYWILNISTILSVTDNFNSNTLNVYPNPVQNSFQINSEGIKIDRILIYSELGKIVKKIEMYNDTTIVDVSGLSSGIYFITMYSGENKTTQKFIKD